MKYHKIVIFFLIFSFLIQLSPAQAADVFDPDFLISDAELQDWDTMGRADIQAFLREKNSYLTRYRVADVTGKKRLASDIIQRASKENQINPKYLLVKLQKEQSLVTATDPTQKQLDWATGYGVCDACKLDDPKIQKYKGFGQQVDAAAGIMRWYYDNFQSETWIKRAGTAYTVDNRTVIPATNATAFLYTYTPHIQGNENFWKLWQRWFDQVYPEGTLVKTKDDPKVYLIQDGKIRPFANWTALTTRFDPKLIITIPESELSRYESGTEISYPNFSILKQGNDYYLLDYDQLRPFENADTVKKLGYHPDEIIDVNLSEIESLPRGKTITTNTTAPTGELVRIKETKKLYFAEDNILYPLVDEKLASVNYPYLKIVTKKSDDYKNYTPGAPILFRDGTLLKIENTPQIYVVDKGKLRHISSEEVFNGLGYQSKNVITVSSIVELLHSFGTPLYLRQESVSTDTKNKNTLIKPDTEKPLKSSSDYRNLMVRTPESETIYVGTPLSTRINTYLIADATTGEILAGKNIDAVRPMASFAKVATAYELMQQGLSLNGLTTYSSSEHKSVYGSFRTADGEKFYNHDLLDAFLLSSINTVGRMLVDDVESNESTFVKKINTRMTELGLKKTKFVDVTGEDAANVTTAREYLTIFQKSTNNGTLKKIMGKTSYRYTEYKDVDGKPDHFDNHSNDLTQNTKLPYTTIASKTGYLYESGAGLATLIERKSDQKRFIVITMGDAEYDQRFTEADKVARFALEQF